MQNAGHWNEKMCVNSFFQTSHEHDTAKKANTMLKHLKTI